MNTTADFVYRGIDILYNCSILLSALLAFIYRKYLPSRLLVIMLPFLIYVLIQEVTLDLGNVYGFIPSNAIVYNLYRPLTVLVFFWIYYNLPFMAPLRKFILWLTVAYIVIAIVNYCFIESIFKTSSYLSLFRGFTITFFAVLFLFRYFQLDNLSEERYWRPLLWITAGIAVFYPVVSISLTFQKYLAEEGLTFYGIKLYNLIPQVMSIFMYSCFAYAFYLCKKIT